MIIQSLNNKLNINNIINYVIILFILSIPFNKDITKILSLTLFILWLCEGKFKEKWNLLKSSKVVIAFVLFLIYNYISIIWSSHTISAVYYVNKYLYYLPFVLIFTSIKRQYIKYAIIAFLVAMFISEIITYGIYFHYWTTHYNITHPSNSPTAFMSHTIYSAIIAFVAILTLYKILLHKNKYLTFVYLFFYITISINLFISGGRTGLIPYIIVQLFLLFYILKNKKKYLFVTISLIVILSISAYKTLPVFKHRIDAGLSNINTLISHKNFNTSWGARVAMIYVGSKIIADNPIIGVGIKDNMDEMVNYANKTKQYNLKFLKRYHKWHFHNQYIDILTQLGIIGLILFLSIFYYLWKLKIDDKELHIIKMLFILHILFSIISSDLFHQKHYIYFIGLFIGLILAQNRYEQIGIQNND